jgi:hypothetical protein
MTNRRDGDGNCGGVFNTGKCVLTRKQYEAYGLNVRTLPRNTTRVLCINCTNEYGERNRTLRTKGLRKRLE